MSVTTSVLTANFYEQGGQPYQGVTLTAVLYGIDVQTKQYVARDTQTTTSDATGLAQLTLFANASGTRMSYYRITATAPNGVVISDSNVSIPAYDCNLADVEGNWSGEIFTGGTSATVTGNLTVAGFTTLQGFSGAMSAGSITGITSFIPPSGTSSAPTAEGSMYWNTSTDTLTVGNGAAAEVLVTTDNSQTLTNKTISLSNNSVSGTLSQFDSALTDGSFVNADGADHIDFSATPSLAGAARRLQWNATDGTLDLGLEGGNVTLQVGQEQVVRVHNNTGSTLTDGQVVYVTGSQGQRLTVALAQGNSEATSTATIAVVTEHITNNQSGFATASGLVRDLDTSAFAEGAALYLSPSVAGGITTTEPLAPNHAVRLGWCVRSHPTQGQIFVHVQNGYELDELHDVRISGVANGDILQYVSANSRWENTPNVSSLVSYTPAGTGAVSTNVQTKLREFVSVKDFGAVGDGVADDTAELQAAMTYVATNGGVLFIPAGTYNISNVLVLTNTTKPFSIIGAGRDATKIVRSTNYNGSLISINTADNWLISDLTLIGNHSIYSNGNHGISWANCSYVRVLRVNVYDWKNSAIIGFTSPANTTNVDNVIEDCWVDGNNAANNGILIADLVKSGIRNCSAVNIGKTGSPCYALQMKNGCQDSFIEGGLATNATIGVACGNYDVSGTHTRNRISGVRVFGCDAGLAFGNAIGDHASNLIIDMNSTGLAAVDFNLNTVGCSARGISVFNLAAGKQAVRFRSGDTDNVAEIDTISNSSGVVQLAADFNAGSLRNSVKLRRYVNPTTVTSTSTLVSNASGSQTNIFEYEAIPMRQVATIASGIVTIRDSSVQLLRLDTEGAAATDDLDNIANGTDGQIITVETTANARDVVVKHLSAGGNIRLNGLADFTLDGAADSLTLIYKSAVSQWCEVCRSNNI